MTASQSQPPPSQFTELQALATRIRRGDGVAPRLSPRALALFDALLGMPETVGLSTISHLAEQQGVNPSALTRLSRALGYPGFKAFQAVFRDGLTGSAFYSTRAERLLDFGETPEAAPDGTQDHAVWQQEMANLSAAVEGLDGAALTRAVEAVRAARRIHVVGLRASFGAAHYLAYYLGYLRDDVHLVSSQAGVDIEQALSLTDEDLVIGIAFRPETRTSLDYCRLAREQGATLVALTNHPQSQLAGMTECRLVAPAEGPFFFNPMSSLFLLVELLLSRIAHDLGSTAVAAIRRREALIARLSLE